MIDCIEKRIPDELRKRLLNSNKWLSESFEKIRKPVENVEEFVVLIGVTKDINEKF
jgi:flagellar biosynthesis regulator FlaF